MRADNCYKLVLLFNPWLPELFGKTDFLNILEIVRLHMHHISSNLLKKAFSTWQHAFLSTCIAVYDIFAQACAEIKTLRKLPISLGFSFFLHFFFSFPSSPSLNFLLQQGLSFYWACLQFKKFWRSIIKMGNFYDGVAMCRCGKFFSEVFTQISLHFCEFLCSPHGRHLKGRERLKTNT